MRFFCTSETDSLPAAGLLSRSRLRGKQGARVYTRRTFGPWPGSVARGLGVQSRSIWQVKSRDRLPTHRAKQGHGKPQNVINNVFRSAAVYQYLLQVPHQPSKGVFFDAATVQQQPRSRRSPFATDMNSACACVSVCVCAIEPTGSYSKQQELPLLL